MAKAKKTTKSPLEQEYKKELNRIKQFLRRANKRGFVWVKDPVPKQPKKITQKSVERLKKLTPEVLYKKGEYAEPETGLLIPGATGRKRERKLAIEKAKETRRKNKNKDKKKNKKEEKQPDTELTIESTTNQKTAPPEDIKTKELKGEHPSESGTVDDIEFYDDDFYDIENNYIPEFVDIALTSFTDTLEKFKNASGTPILREWFNTLLRDHGKYHVAQMLQDAAEQGIELKYEIAYNGELTNSFITEMMDYLPDAGNWYKDSVMDMLEEFENWGMPQ